MKTRKSYVSNSSSSSFIIAYDSALFGDLSKFFSSIDENSDYHTTTETGLVNLEEELENWANSCDDEEERKGVDRLLQAVNENLGKGMKVIAIRIDHDQDELLELLKFMSQQKNGKFEILAGLEPYETTLPDYHSTI